MRTGRALSLIALAAGVLLLAYSGVQGDLSVHLVLIIPVISGSGPAAALGMLLAIGGLFGLFWTGIGLQGPGPGPGQGPGSPAPTAAKAAGPEATSSSQRRSGGIILLGPIPIAWGSGKEGRRWAVALGIVLTVLAVLLFYLFGGTLTG